jgi:predicted permease
VEASGNYFDTLQIHPFLGRFFHASDEHGPNSAPYVVLTWSWWHSHFQDDRSVIGRKVLISRHPFTVIGVTPPSFEGTLLFFVPDMFVPMVDGPEINGWDGLNDRGNRWVFQTLGHLRPGVTPAQAAVNLDAIGKYLERTYPTDFSHREFRLINPALYGSFLGNPVRGFVTGLMLLAGLILLAACANLGSLFAARASDRSREVALRLALGSSRRRIVRQLMTEALLISVAGGVVGLAISVVLLRRLSVWRPLPEIPVHLPVTPDARVYLMALLLAVVSGILFGMVPVRQVLRAHPWEVVKAGSGGRIGGKSGLRDFLLVVQIAVCALMVTSSLVALRGLLRSLHTNFGFDPQHVVLAQIDLSMAGYHDDQVAAIQKRILDAVQALPGVKSAATINNPPLIPSEERKFVYREETRDLRVSQAAAAPYRYIISPDYFEAAGTPLLAGRAFTPHDDLSSPRVAIVNEQFARSVLGSASGAIGRSFRLDDGTRVQIVGLVPDGKYLNLTEDLQSAMFIPVLQKPWGQTTLVVRTAGDPQLLISALRNTLRGIDPGMSAEIHPWTQELDYALFGSRITTLALSVLGLMGIMLSITGIFGMAACAVSQRMRELGIRMAVGAQRIEILNAALGRALRLLALGSVTGLVLGILASRALAFLIYEPGPGDPLVLGGVVLTMLLLGLIATWIPAHRAISIDPLALLREE